MVRPVFCDCSRLRGILRDLCATIFGNKGGSKCCSSWHHELGVVLRSSVFATCGDDCCNDYRSSKALL